MEPKDKLESLKFISKTHRTEFNERRKHEWRIFFSALALYVFSVIAIYGGKIELPSNSIVRVIIWIIFPFVAVATTIFLAYIHMANNINKTFAERAEHNIDDLLQSKEMSKLPVFSDKKSEGYWVDRKTFFTDKRNSGRWSLIWQGATLLLFSIISAFLIALK